MKKKYRLKHALSSGTLLSEKTNILPILLPTVFFCISVGISLFYWQDKNHLVKENGILESGQVFFLIASVLAHTFKGVLFKNYHFLRDIHIGAALFIGALVLRELDIREIGESNIWLYTEKALRITLFLIIVYYLFRMFLKRQHFIKNVTVIIKSNIILLGFLACLVYLFGWPYDKNIFKMASLDATLIEEILELNASIIFFISSLTTNRVLRTINYEGEM